MNDPILTINAGSSSLKFAVFDHDRPMVRAVEGKFERIGLPDGTLAVTDRGNPRPSAANWPWPITPPAYPH